MAGKILGSGSGYGYADLANINERQAAFLYQNGSETFSKPGRMNKAKGFFMESVGGKVLNEKFGKSVSVPDVEASDGRLKFTKSHPQSIRSMSRGDEAMLKFGDIVEADERQNTDNIQFGG